MSWSRLPRASPSLKILRTGLDMDLDNTLQLTQPEHRVVLTQLQRPFGPQ